MRESNDFGRNPDNGSHDKKPKQSPRYDPSVRGDVKDGKIFWLGFTTVVLVIIAAGFLFW